MVSEFFGCKLLIQVFRLSRFCKCVCEVLCSSSPVHHHCLPINSELRLYYVSPVSCVDSIQVPLHKGPPSEMPTSIAVELVKELCETCKVISDAPTIQCDRCSYWFHSQCERRDVDERSQAEHWYCSKCSRISKDLDEVLGNESTDEDKIADENEFDENEFVVLGCFREKLLKPALIYLNSPTDENSEVDVNPDWDRCGTCNERYNGAKPMVRCDRCQYHCSCQGVPYDEARKKWQCSTCGAEPVNSVKEGEESEWLDNALTETSQLFEFLISKVGPIRDPALKDKLEQLKLKIETILNKVDTGKSLFANHFPLKQQESNSVSWHLLIKISLFILSVGCEECEENGEARSGSKKNETAESSESKKSKLKSLVSSAEDLVGTSMEASEAKEDLQPEGNYKV